METAQRPTTINLQYNIPQVVLGAGGRQNRYSDGVLRMTAGMTEPFQFVWGDINGVPLTLVDFTAKLVFWVIDRINPEAKPQLQDLNAGTSRVVLSVPVDIYDPHKGLGYAVLSSQDTMTIAQVSETTGVRWGVFLINKENQVFPSQVTSGGGRSGYAVVEKGELPIGEIILGS